MKQLWRTMAYIFTTALFSFLFFSCGDDTVEQEWSLRPTNDGIGIWKGTATTSNNDTLKVSDSLKQGNLYSLVTILNNEVIYKEQGQWSFENTELEGPLFTFTPASCYELDNLNTLTSVEPKQSYTILLQTETTFNYLYKDYSDIFSGLSQFEVINLTYE